MTVLRLDLRFPFTSIMLDRLPSVVVRLSWQTLPTPHPRTNRTLTHRLAGAFQQLPRNIFDALQKLESIAFRLQRLEITASILETKVITL